jgi:L-threonylcarbamoyladenylate synthase
MIGKPHRLKPDESGLTRAAAILADGGLVALPTETVYGLGADATRDEAVARIFAVKARPQFNPLIIHVPDIDAARALVAFDPLALRLAARFWPGPLTLVLPRAKDCPVSWLASAGLTSLAVRVPGLAVTRDLLKRAGIPVAAPSANRSGRLSPTTAADVLAELGDGIDAVLDGGPSSIGIESTVIDLSGPAPLLLRPGGVARQALEPLTGPLGGHDAQNPLRGPGLLASHYAPGLPLRLNARDIQPDEALLAFGPKPIPGSALNLSETGDLTQAAARLFGALRALDLPAYKGIAVMPIPEEGLGEAINDRLRRAAAPR